MYRVMVIGEDHTEFCYEDDIFEEDIKDVLDEANENYPCGLVYVENM